MAQTKLDANQVTITDSSGLITATNVEAALMEFATAIRSGNGSPLNVVVANIGTLYRRLDGGANTTLYVKESGNGLATGWVAK